MKEYRLICPNQEGCIYAKRGEVGREIVNREGGYFCSRVSASSSSEPGNRVNCAVIEQLNLLAGISKRLAKAGAIKWN